MVSQRGGPGFSFCVGRVLSMLESACSQRVVVSFLHVLRFTPQSKTSIPAVTSSRCLQPFLSGAKCPSPPNRMGEPILTTL